MRSYELRHIPPTSEASIFNGITYYEIYDTATQQKLAQFSTPVTCKVKSAEFCFKITLEDNNTLFVPLTRCVKNENY